MYAMHHPPKGAPRATGVLLCNPFGQEAIRSHRLFRVLADQLARQGFHVLRFDYFATGDSAGEDGEGDIEGWCRDVLSADDELRRRSGCTRTSWFGLRLGATIAALASLTTQHALDRIVLWDPVVDGPVYRKEMYESHLAACAASFGARWTFDQELRDMAKRAAEDEVIGFALPGLLRDQLRQICAQRLAAAQAHHVALLAEPALPGLTSLWEQITRLGKSVSVVITENKINWTSNEAMDSSIVPPRSLQAAVSLLTGEQ
jgi:pimeloyl-ACP methyl ester carboxylesterase